MDEAMSANRQSQFGDHRSLALMTMARIVKAPDRVEGRSPGTLSRAGSPFPDGLSLFGRRQDILPSFSRGRAVARYARPPSGWPLIRRMKFMAARMRPITEARAVRPPSCRNGAAIGIERHAERLFGFENAEAGWRMARSRASPNSSPFQGTRREQQQRIGPHLEIAGT